MTDNPFAGPDVPRSYHGLQGKKLVKYWPEPGPPDAVAGVVHSSFHAMVMSEQYSCAFARSAIGRGAYRFGCYPRLGTPLAAQSVSADLWQFIQDFPIDPDRFATFAAAFDGPVTATEEQFEELLWRQLQLMHDLDIQFHRWDAAVGTDPNRWGFSFSFAERAFFIVGLHPGASRWARRTAWPTIIFNAHAQFEILRRRGQMPRMTEVIRRRDVRVQGATNPSLSYFDARKTEAVLYSGRFVEPDWRCPLQIREV